MMFGVYRGLKRAGVLGINARNVEYLLRCNPRFAFPRVDDKTITKDLARQQGIPTPLLYHAVRRHVDVGSLEEALLGRRDFVVKPACGAGGNGILLVTDRTSKGFVNQEGELVSWADFNYHVLDILSGIYSLSGHEDTVMFEELVRPDPVFSSVTFEGVPDVRVIVYRGIPVMGMVRLPTRASRGRANLHQGAIGAGIGIATGLTLTAVSGTMIVTHHPDTGHPVSGLQVPYWRTMLLLAASAFDMTGLCFLGADIIVDRRRGPLLLELNARPGLSIQIANLSGLRKRLLAVDKAPPDVFSTPEMRVSWALEAFNSESARREHQ